MMDNVDDEPSLKGDRSSHAMKLQQHMYDQFISQSDYCDVSLAFGGMTIKAHWCVLVSCPYFQSLYDSAMTEKITSRVNIGVGKNHAVRTAIAFLYTGTVEIKYSILQDILEVADYFQIDDLKTACASYMDHLCIQVHNCVELSLVASLYNLDIYHRVYNYMRGHLPEVMQLEDTLSLTAESVLALLRDKSLHYVLELDFYHFIVKWVQHDRCSREVYFEAMFCELNLYNMSQDFLENEIEKLDLVAMSDKCKAHLLNVKSQYSSGLLQSESKSDVILLVGGCGLGSFYSYLSVLPSTDVVTINHIYGYIIAEDRWTELAPLPFSMQKPLVTFCESMSSLYVYDASLGTPVYDNEAVLFKYDIEAKVWINFHLTLPAAYTDIMIQQLLIVNKCLYIIASGKSFPKGAAQAVQWVAYLFKVSGDMSSCNTTFKLFPRNPKTQISACVLQDRYLCILGFKCGMTASNRTKNVRFFMIDTVSMRKQEFSKQAVYEPLMFARMDEVVLTKPGDFRYRTFNIVSKRWTMVRSMLIPLTADNVTDGIQTVFKDKVYMFGGKIGRKPIDMSSVYNITEQKWAVLTAAPKPVANCGVVVAKLDKNLIRCHVDCPHCMYQNIRGQATYQIDYPYEGEDEDDEDNTFDEDLCSDYWDDDVFDYDYDDVSAYDDWF